MFKTRQLGAGWIPVALVAVLLLPACNSVTSSDSTDQGVSTQLNWNKTANCPSVEEMSALIVSELEANCPGVASYRNWGDENSCTQRTIGKTLNSCKSCFSGAQMKEIRTLVQQALTAPNTNKPSDEPSPEQQ